MKKTDINKYNFLKKKINTRFDKLYRFKYEQEFSLALKQFYNFLVTDNNIITIIDRLKEMHPEIKSKTKEAFESRDRFVTSIID